MRSWTLGEGPTLPVPGPGDDAERLALLALLPIPAVLVRGGRPSPSRGVPGLGAGLVGGEEVLLELAMTAAAAGEPLTRELSGLRTDRCFVRAVPRPLGDGVLVELVDDTELAGRLRHDELSQSLLERLVQTLPVALAAKDPRDGMRFVLLNQRFVETFGIRREDVLGRSDHDLFPRELADKYRADDEAVLVGEGARIIDEEIETALGRRKARTIKVPIRDASGRPELLLVMVQDLTELELEFRPGGDAGAEARGTVDEVLDAALADLLPWAEARGARVRVERAPETVGDGAPWVRADPERVAAALAHLVRNGVAFSPRGAAVRVAVRSDPAADEVLLEVHDDGVGMTPEYQAALRARIERPGAASGGSPLLEDGGIGLVLCRQLVAAEGGRITFESQLGEGSVFRLHLPVRRRCTKGGGRAAANGMRALAALSDTGTWPRPALGPAARRGRVLLAEDDAMYQRIASRQLEALGHDVVLAASGPDALELLREQREHFDFLVVDLRLGDADGLDLIRALRRMEARDRVRPEDALPTIAVTPGDGDPLALDRDRLPAVCLEVGADAWLEKPLRAAQLEEELARIDRRTA